MPIIDTKSLFEKIEDREQLTYPFVKSIFRHLPAEAVHFELLQQGLLQQDKMYLTIDVWQIIQQQLEQLIVAWDGPDVPIAILPIQHGFEKNGVAYPHGICLFVSAKLELEELHALFIHEYHHICRRRFISEPPTLLDSILMEGLAEHAVESLLGEHALNSWTKRYSLAEAPYYWNTHFIQELYLRGLHKHKAFLLGDVALNLPPWIGYCLGYRIVEAFQEKMGPYDVKQLLSMPAEDLLAGAGWKNE